jgi:hypothetical protein
MAAEAPPRSTAYDLCNALDLYISCNEHGRSLEDRWLCDELQPFREMARVVRNNKLGPEHRAKVNAFRALEIEDEIQKKRHDLESLERDLKKVKAA